MQSARQHCPSSSHRRTTGLRAAAAASLAALALATAVPAAGAATPTPGASGQGSPGQSPSDQGSSDQGAVAADGDILWSDEFDGPAGSAPDDSRWGYDTGANGWGNNELENYTTSRDNSALDGDGNLVITARQEADGSYTSARLTTQGKHQPKYGRIEARLQMPRGQGIWPAFWMLGGNIATTPWPDSGEIDIMENVGYEPHLVHGTLHGPGYSGANPLTGSFMHPQGWSFADDFHTFAVDWKPGSITWLVDGEPYQTYTSADTGGNPWAFDHDFYILLNVAVGGNWPGYPDDTTQLPQQMKVDYVRVYDNGATGAAAAGTGAAR